MSKTKEVRRYLALDKKRQKRKKIRRVKLQKYRENKLVQKFLENELEKLQAAALAGQRMSAENG